MKTSKHPLKFREEGPQHAPFVRGQPADTAMCMRPAIEARKGT